MATAQKIPPNVLAAAGKIPPNVLTIVKTDSVQLANAQKFAPELAVIQAHPALFTKLATYTNPAKIPGPLLGQAINAAGGGAKGVAMLTTHLAEQGGHQRRDRGRARPAEGRPVRGGPEDHRAVLGAAEYHRPVLGAADRAVQGPARRRTSRYLKAHATAVQNAAAKTAGQWKTWYWICFGGVIFFLLSIPLLRGRWRTRDAKRDEAEHEAKVQEELAKLQATV